MMSAKIAILGLLKIKLFSNKGYNVRISVHDVTNKTWSRDSNYIADAVMWSNFGSISIYDRSYDVNFLRIWPRKPLFWGVVLVEV